MKKEFQIRIPEPCHEDWENMTPNEKGNFCTFCSKTVFDFSNLSNEEIQSFFRSRQNENVCGRFLKTQLDSIIIELPIELIPKQRSFHKIFLIALLLVMGSTLFSCNLSNGKSSNIEEIVIVDTTYTPAKRIDQKVLNELIDSLLDDPISIKEIESLPNTENEYYFFGEVFFEERKFLIPNPNFNLNEVEEIEEEEEIDEFAYKVSLDETIIGEISPN